jgi:hypothetical protein
MCEVNVTCLIDDVDPFDLSHSAAEAGSPNRWSDALDIAKGRRLPGLDLDDAKEFFAGFGAWDRAEIARWTRKEIVALVLQFAAGDLREAQSLTPGDGLGDIDWTAYEALASEGTVGGRIYAHEGALYVSLAD